VLGVSRDSLSSHQQFAEKLDLPFPLLSDPEGTVCELYGVLRERTTGGKTRLALERSTFLIDETGRLLAIWRKVKPAGHAGSVLQQFDQLVGNSLP
jgi:peroxiredoxin Q/BCP